MTSFLRTGGHSYHRPDLLNRKRLVCTDDGKVIVCARHHRAVNCDWCSVYVYVGKGGVWDPLQKRLRFGGERDTVRHEPYRRLSFDKGTPIANKLAALEALVFMTARETPHGIVLESTSSIKVGAINES
jgi:hypothetical protein